MASHWLRGRVTRKEESDLSGNHQRNSCNFVKREPAVGYFTLSFDKLTFFNGPNFSAKHSDQLYHNQASLAEVGTLKISTAFSLRLPH